MCLPGRRQRCGDQAERGAEMAVTAGRSRAAYAADPGVSRGRLHGEPPSPSRTDFRRDCDRIIHATAFRRLAHKTQVFIYHEGDHYRTRLTHTLEVVQIARSLARALGLDEDLAEACALGHDLGHPPFGHSGERALDRCLAKDGGFDHNAQTLSVVTRLERRYAGFDGLNLTWETLEGLVKHNGPLIDANGAPARRRGTHGVPPAIAEYCEKQDLELASYPSAEAQAGAIADDIAYDAHDIDDGLRAHMFAIDDLEQVPLLAGILADIRARHAEIEPVRRAHELVRGLIARMINDVISETTRLIATREPRSVDDVRRAGAPLVAFSPTMAAQDRAIKDFLLPRLYRHPRIVRIMDDAEAIVVDLFDRYRRCARDLSQRALPAADRQPRQIADFIAGMTDRYALSEHKRLFDSTPELR
jgi:dGTPase